MKSRIYIPSISNLFVPEGKGQSVGRRSRMVTLVAGLSALVMVTFGAIALGGMAAADGPVVVANANPDLAERDRNYGTYTSQWSGIVDRELGANPVRAYGTYTSQWSGIVDREFAANPDVAELGRNYGTYTSQWIGIIDREFSANPGRAYGTYTSQWSGIVDRELGASPDVAELGRSYGTYTSQWNGIVDRELAANPDVAELDRKYGTFAGVWWSDFANR